MSGRKRTWNILAGAVSLSLWLPSAALAQSEADFFKGKTVNYIIATAPGGGYDYYGRLVAEYMQKHLPGSTFVVRNMPGAGHIIGANYLYASKPDGLTIGTFNTGLIYNQLVGLDSLKADLTKMSWIGKASTDPRAVMVSATSPIKTFADLQASKQIIFSTSGVGSGGYAETKVLSEMLNLPIKLVTGYNGNDDQLAMRRGEVTGNINTRSSWEPFVKNGYGRFHRPDRRTGEGSSAALDLCERRRRQGCGRADRIAGGNRPPDGGTSRDSAGAFGGPARGLQGSHGGQGVAGKGGEGRASG